MNLTKTLGMLAILATVHTAMAAEAVSNEHEHPTLEDVGNIHTFKAPLYWSIYERAYELDGSDWDSRNIPLSEWEANFDWIAKELKPHGYDMICTDGFLPFNCDNGELFMTRLGQVPLKDLIKAAKDRGLRVGIYDSPLEAWSDKNNIIPGTQYTVGSLLYDASIDNVLHPEAEDKWHTYIVFSHPGAKEYVDEFFRHYSELGVDMIRMDFLSWFEDGYFRLWDTPVGKGYGRQIYADALAYVCKKAQEYGIFLSLVMPHLYNDAEIESRYGNMVRIVNDTMEGGWGFTSASEQGKAYLSWPTSQNQFDGFTYWSRRIAGRDKVILDGDFTIMHSYTTPAEKEFAVSIQLMAGGPIAVTDQYCTIGEGNVAYYTNDEMLALNKDRFVGHPLDDTLMSYGSNIWYGQMSNGDYVVGFFNRDDQNKTFSLDLADIGIKHQVAVRDLWKHRDEGRTSRLEATVEPHGCKIMRLRIVLDDQLYLIGDATPITGKEGWDIDQAIPCTKSGEGNIFVYEGYLKAGKFRAVTTKEWGIPHIRPKVDECEIGSEGYDGDFSYVETPDYNWKVTEPGNYRLTFDLDNRTIKVIKWPDVSPIQTETLYLIGSATPITGSEGWDIDQAIPCTKSGEGNIFVYEGHLKAGIFRATTNKKYGTHIRPKVDECEIGPDGYDGEFTYVANPDYNWKVTEPGNYSITFDLDNWTIKVIKWPDVTPIQTETLYLIGSATPITGSEGWDIDQAIPCTKSGEGNIFVYEGHLKAGIFRATTNKKYGTHIRPKVDECEIGPDGYDGEFTYVANPDYNWKVTEPGNYSITFDLDNWTIKVIKWPEVTPIQTETLYLIGDATPIIGKEGWDIDQAIPCTKSGERNIFVYEGNLKAGKFRAVTTREWYIPHIRPKVDECEIGPDRYDGAFTYVDTPDYNWKVTESGKYRFTFDLDNWTIKAEYIKVPTSVPFVTDDTKNLPCEYYNLNGVKVKTPVKGIYIVKQGSKVSKVIIN